MSVASQLPRGALRVAEPGRPESLEWGEDMLPTPGATGLVVRHEAIGINYHDNYLRSGQYRTMSFPGIPGIETSGAVKWKAPTSPISESATGSRMWPGSTGHIQRAGCYRRRKRCPCRRTSRTRSRQRAS